MKPKLKISVFLFPLEKSRTIMVIRTAKIPRGNRKSDLHQISSESANLFSRGKGGFSFPPFPLPLFIRGIYTPTTLVLPFSGSFSNQRFTFLWFTSESCTSFGRFMEILPRVGGPPTCSTTRPPRPDFDPAPHRSATRSVRSSCTAEFLPRNLSTGHANV